MSDLETVRKVADLERRLAALAALERPRTNYGAASPTGWPTNVPFYRTDLGWWIFYDGTRWLTVHETVHPLAEGSGAGAFATRSALRTNFTPYFTRVSFRAFVVAPNNGTNYWNMVVQTTDAAITAGTTIRAQNTSADGAGAWLVYDLAPTTNVPGAGNHYWLRLNCAIAAGAPGSLTCNAIAWYRLVIP